MTGANARRVVELAKQFPKTRVSVLVEASEQLSVWRDTGIGIFVDVNPGMNRTGMDNERADEIVKVARESGWRFGACTGMTGILAAVRRTNGRRPRTKVMTD